MIAQGAAEAGLLYDGTAVARMGTSVSGPVFPQNVILPTAF